MTARVNVRGELVAMVCNGCSGASEEAAEQWADDMLREHARQLAEEIRTHIDDIIREHGIGYTDGGWYGAAKLIDPEVTS
ncbi:hypothetical protein HEK616_40720 [Streptomyces nigrescens]|uniref:Uncharacterized protein n=1 Tax=Streptomyces nigrescens TaxID=1920 RepID=A0ABM7ZW61_STRNI|nr:hypothetical protein [Streptomyces nigrescens]BDM70585.1 hypothetical protein HEK616_40720 [Streptomyces nigrescens]